MKESPALAVVAFVARMCDVGELRGNVEMAGPN